MGVSAWKGAIHSKLPSGSCFIRNKGMGMLVKLGLISIDHMRLQQRNALIVVYAGVHKGCREIDLWEMSIILKAEVSLYPTCRT